MVKLLLAISVGAGIIAWGAARWRRRQHRLEVERINALIKQPQKVYEGHDDALRVATLAKRADAERLRRRAARVEAGDVKIREVRKDGTA